MFAVLLRCRYTNLFVVSISFRWTNTHTHTTNNRVARKEGISLMCVCVFHYQNPPERRADEWVRWRKGQINIAFFLGFIHSDAVNWSELMGSLNSYENWLPWKVRTNILGALKSFCNFRPVKRSHDELHAGRIFGEIRDQLRVCVCVCAKLFGD